MNVSENQFKCFTNVKAVTSYAPICDGCKFYDRHLKGNKSGYCTGDEYRAKLPGDVVVRFRKFLTEIFV